MIGDVSHPAQQRLANAVTLASDGHELFEVGMFQLFDGVEQGPPTALPRGCEIRPRVDVAKDEF